MKCGVHNSECSGDLRERLGAIIAERLGPPGEVLAMTRLTGGATRTTWSLDVRIGDQVQPLILQQTHPRDITPGGPINLMARVQGDSEARLIAAARGAGVPVPAVRLVLQPEDGLGAGFITDRISGETIGRRINREPVLAGARRLLPRQCGQILASIHTMDTDSLPFLARHDAAAQVAAYRAIWDAFDHPLPTMELGLKWAGAHIPTSEHLAVVHGDFRNGNFIVGPDGIRAVLDWELAHLGDPVEDLGWLLVKTWRFGGKLPVGGFGRREDLLESYEQAGGPPVSPNHLLFWEAFGCLKWAVMCTIKGEGYLRDPRERTVEALAIGRRTEEPLYDFLNLIFPEVE